VVMNDLPLLLRSLSTKSQITTGDLKILYSVYERSNKLFYNDISSYFQSFTIPETKRRKPSSEVCFDKQRLYAEDTLLTLRSHLKTVIMNMEKVFGWSPYSDLNDTVLTCKGLFAFDDIDAIFLNVI
jgi:hypothetical protein